MLTLLFDGVAYGMLLFVLACGLAVTLGLMNFVNLAHGAFAMTGGYVCAVLVNSQGWPFFTALPLAFVASAAIGIALERTQTLMQGASHCDFTVAEQVEAFEAMVKWERDGIKPSGDAVVTGEAFLRVREVAQSVEKVAHVRSP